MNISFDMVIHAGFGAFSLTDEIVDRLRKRGCAWASDVAKAGATGTWYLPARIVDDDEARRDPDLVAVVKELEEELESRVENVESWREREAIEQQMLNGLKVVTVQVSVEILDHDGRESVRVFGIAS